MAYRGQDESKRTRVLVIFLSLFILLLVVAHWLVNTRESACAEYCRLSGSAHYVYRDFSGSEENLGADSCHCLNALDASKKPDVGSAKQ